MGVLIGALVALAASLTPALAPLAIGGGIGAAGGLAAGKLGTTGLTTLRADRQALAQAEAALKGPRGNTPSNRLSLTEAQAALQKAQAKYGGFVPFGRATTNLGNSAIGTLLGALTGNAPGLLTGGNKGGQVPGTSFLAGLTPILSQVGTFLKQIGPGLGDLFRTSLPFISAFLKIFEQLAKAMMPAFLQSMKSITPFLPTLVKGFAILSQGLADFIKDLGPGMKDSTTVFLGLMEATKGVLIALAYGANYAAKFLANFGHVAVDVGRVIAEYWKKLEALDAEQRKRIATDYDAIRHSIASAWDDIYQNTIGRVGRMVGDVMNWDVNLRHSIANEYDNIRGDIASAWNTIWTNTINAISRGVHNVEGWFERLPGNIKNLLSHLGSMLEGVGKAALTDFLNGLKSIGSGVLSWLKNFFGGIPSAIMHLLHMSPPHPGSAFFDLGANFMHHLEAGMKSRVGSIKGVSGNIGGSVNGWIMQSLKLLSWLPALQRLVSLESGGNPRAVDPISVGGQHAEGLWQMLPSTFAGEGGRGSLFNPVVEGIAALRYISSRYGSPFNIPGLFSGGYQGYASGGIISEPIFGMGLSGKAYTFGEGGIHERVTPLGGGGGGGNIYVTVAGDSDPDGAALRIVQKLRKYKTRHGGQALGIG